MTSFIAVISGLVSAGLTCAIVIPIVLLTRKTTEKNIAEQLKQANQPIGFILDEISRSRGETIQTVNHAIGGLSEILSTGQKQGSEGLDKRLSQLIEQLTLQQNSFENSIKTAILAIDERMKGFSQQNEQKLENIRTSVNQSLQRMNEDNTKKLEQMRETVDEKLQKTLNERLGQSFKQVGEQLDIVKEGLGEMRTLATGVGDLKKVLANVKQRGNIGEIQLGAILSEILAPEQYERNYAPNPSSRNRVEFAVKLPADKGDPIYIPIDSKFPGDSYEDLQNAYESGQPELIKAATVSLAKVIRQEAKEVSEKYINPPLTTDFAILFLPFEGLYAEVVRMGMIELLQKEYHINIAGPSTMAALLNCLQMGFQSFAIHKRSGEVWKVLSEVRKEFSTFAVTLAKAQDKITQAGNDIEDLVGKRTRQMQRKLEQVQLPEFNTNEEPILELDVGFLEIPIQK